MPKVSKDGATQGGDHGPVVDRSEELGGYTVNFLTFRQDIDQTPLLKGMPDDRCQCPHWGFVTKGKLTFRFTDHDEVFEAGDAFYLPPGHVGVGNDPDTEYVQFSPSEELREVSAVIMKNMQATQAG
ncbi:MAG: cupin domain-containing protein [Actinobacteria bacterium]|nr:MAG: cupin domain-containing protein [Actinomycetota bacterium]TML74249.1 MAG: cupin domain-containing protein [Actinomycetota bacterium]